MRFDVNAELIMPLATLSGLHNRAIRGFLDLGHAICHLSYSQGLRAFSGRPTRRDTVGLPL